MSPVKLDKNDAVGWNEDRKRFHAQLFDLVRDGHGLGPNAVGDSRRALVSPIIQMQQAEALDFILETMRLLLTVRDLAVRGDEVEELRDEVEDDQATDAEETEAVVADGEIPF